MTSSCRNTTASLLLPLLLICVVAPFVATPPAQAVIFNDPVHTISNLIQFIVHWYQRAKVLIEAYRNTANQIRQIQLQVKALTKMSGIPWREIANLLYMLDVLIARNGSLAYTLDNIDGVLKEIFPGWAASKLSTWRAEKQLRAERVLSTFRGTLSSIGRGSALISNQYKLWDIKTAFEAVEGTQAALEGLGAFLAYIAEEQILQRQAAYAAQNAATVFYADRVHRDAEAEATTISALEGTRDPATARLPNGAYTARPLGWAY